MIVVGIATTRGIRAQAAASQTGLLGKATSDMFASYTSLEKKLLFPVLAIVWLIVKCLQKIGKQKGNDTISKRETELTPAQIRNWDTPNNTKVTPILTENNNEIGATKGSTLQVPPVVVIEEIDERVESLRLLMISTVKTEVGVGKVFQHLDKNNDGALSLKEFKKLIKAVNKKDTTPDLVKAMWNAAQAASSPVLSSDENLSLMSLDTLKSFLGFSIPNKQMRE